MMNGRSDARKDRMKPAEREAMIDALIASINNEIEGQDRVKRKRKSKYAFVNRVNEFELRVKAFVARLFYTSMMLASCFFMRLALPLLIQYAECVPSAIFNRSYPYHTWDSCLEVSTTAWDIWQAVFSIF